MDRRKLLKVELDIVICSIIAEYKSPFTFKFILKQGIKSIETEKPYKYSGGISEITVDEHVKLKTSFVLCTETNVVEEKILKYYLVVLTSSGFKPATSGELNLASLNFNEETTFSLDFKKHNLNQLKINLKINPLAVNILDFRTDLIGNDCFEYLTDQSARGDYSLSIVRSLSNLNLVSGGLPSSGSKIITIASGRLEEGKPKSKDDYEKLEESAKILENSYQEKLEMAELSIKMLTEEVNSQKNENYELLKTIDNLNIRVNEQEQIRIAETKGSVANLSIMNQLRLQLAILEQEPKCNNQINDYSNESPQHLNSQREICSKCENEKSQMQTEHQHLRIKLDEFKAEIENSKLERIALSQSSKNELDPLLVRLSNMQNDYKELSNKCLGLESRLAEESQSNSHLSNLLALSETERELILEKCSELEKLKDNQELAKEIVELTSINKSLAFKLNQSENLEINLSNQISLMNEKINDLQAENVSLSADHANETKALNDRLLKNFNENSKLIELKDEFELCKNRLESDMLEANNKLMILEADNKYLSESVSCLELKYLEEIALLKETVQNKSKDICKLHSSLEALDHENERIKRESFVKIPPKTSFESQIIESDYSNLRFDSKDADEPEAIEKIFSVEQDNKADPRHLNEIRDTIVKLRTENIQLKTDLDNLRKVEADHKAAKQRLSMIETKHRESLNTNFTYKSDMSNLRFQLNSIEEELQIKTFKLNQNEERVDMLEKEIIFRTEQIGTLLNELAEIEHIMLESNPSPRPSPIQAKKSWGFKN